jgi:hypothetical protein
LTADRLFDIVNFGVLPAWVLLLVAPRRQWTQRIVHSVFLPAILAVAYVVAVLKASFPEGASGTSLAGVMALFRGADPWMAVALWFHFVALDLFAGAWEARDAVRRGIPQLAVAPCLVATNLFAPAGLALYFGVRYALARIGTMDET